MTRILLFVALLLPASGAQAGRFLDSIRNAEGGGLQFMDDSVATSRFAVTAAPVLLPLGITKAKVELALASKLSVNLSLVGGSWLWQGGVLGAGAQVLLYPTGSFHRGTQLGISALQLMELDEGLDALPGKLIGLDDFLLVGPVVGWKQTTKTGTVLEVQLGLNQLKEDGKIHGSYPWVPTLGLNYGWAL